MESALTMTSVESPKIIKSKINLVHFLSVFVVPALSAGFCIYRLTDVLSSQTPAHSAFSSLLRPLFIHSSSFCFSVSLPKAFVRLMVSLEHLYPLPSKDTNGISACMQIIVFVYVYSGNVVHVCLSVYFQPASQHPLSFLVNQKESYPVLPDQHQHELPAL